MEYFRFWNWGGFFFVKCVKNWDIFRHAVLSAITRVGQPTDPRSGKGAGDRKEVKGRTPPAKMHLLLPKYPRGREFSHLSQSTQSGEGEPWLFCMDRTHFLLSTPKYFKKPGFALLHNET